MSGVLFGAEMTQDSVGCEEIVVAVGSGFGLSTYVGSTVGISATWVGLRVTVGVLGSGALIGAVVSLGISDSGGH